MIPKTEDEGAVFVSVLMITYNHNRYINEAIESVLMQKTDFKFELVIGEDSSTDNTRNICEYYTIRNPSQIILLPQEKNLGSILNFVRTLEACSGKYIALCEGDDYWTDSHKLQKQVDFMEVNHNFSLCFHNVMYKFEDGRNSFPALKENEFGIEVPVTKLFQRNFIPTCSILFRAEIIRKLPKFYFNYPFGDWTISLINALNGKLGYLNEKMGIYRIHDSNLWANAWDSKNPHKIITNISIYIRFLKDVNEYFNFKYTREINFSIQNFRYKRLNYILDNTYFTGYFFIDLFFCLIKTKEMHYSLKHLVKLYFVYMKKCIMIKMRNQT